MSPRQGGDQDTPDPLDPGRGRSSRSSAGGPIWPRYADSRVPASTRFAHRTVAVSSGRRQIEVEIGRDGSGHDPRREIVAWQAPIGAMAAVRRRRTILRPDSVDWHATPRAGRGLGHVRRLARDRPGRQAPDAGHATSARWRDQALGEASQSSVGRGPSRSRRSAVNQRFWARNFITSSRRKRRSPRLQTR